MKYSKTIAGHFICDQPDRSQRRISMPQTGGESMQGNRKSSGMHRRGAHGSYNGRTDRRIIKEYRSYDDRIGS